MRDMKELKLHTHREVTINARLWNLLHSLSQGGMGKSIYFWNTGSPANILWLLWSFVNIQEKKWSTTIHSYIFWGAQLGGGAEIVHPFSLERYRSLCYCFNIRLTLLFCNCPVFISVWLSQTSHNDIVVFCHAGSSVNTPTFTPQVFYIIIHKRPRRAPLLPIIYLWEIAYSLTAYR